MSINESYCCLWTSKIVSLTLSCITIAAVVTPCPVYALASYYLNSYITVDCTDGFGAPCTPGIVVSSTPGTVTKNGGSGGNGTHTEDAQFNPFSTGATTLVSLSGSAYAPPPSWAWSTATSQGTITLTNDTPNELNVPIKVGINWTMIAATSELGELAYATLIYDVLVTDKGRNNFSLFEDHTQFPRGGQVISANGLPPGYESNNFNNFFVDMLVIPGSGGKGIIRIDPIANGAVPEPTTLALVGFGLAAFGASRCKRNSSIS